MRVMVILWSLSVQPWERQPPRWEGMDFTVEYDGVEIGEGFMWKIGREEVAASK